MREWKSVSVLTSIAGVVGAVVGAWLFMDDRWAHAEEVRGSMKLLELNTELRFVQSRSRDITSELSALALKEKYGQATAYDRARREQLERELERMTADERDIQQLRRGK